MTDPEFDIPEFSYNRRRREPAFDPLMRRIALGAGGIATLVILVALVWGGIKPGLSFGPPPEIKAPPGPLRLAPANPGGITVPGADQQIMSGQTAVAPSALAPAGPAPDISAFKAQPASSPRQAATPEVSPSIPAQVAAPAPTAGNIQVQLAAAVDPAGAELAWARLHSKIPALLSGRSPTYSHAKVAGVEFWRLRIGGFSNNAAARQFCASVRAKGQACTIAAF